MDITFIPNLVYYIKTGKWNADIDDNDAAIKCCFNANVECNNIFNNDIPPAVLAEFCVNADNAKECIDKLLNAVYGLGEFNELSKKFVNVVSILGKKCSLGKKNYKLESIMNMPVREFLKTHNYDIELAQKEFNWGKYKKHYWKKTIEEGRV